MRAAISAASNPSREISPAPKKRRLHVTQPIEGKNVLTLQTCTLPDYSQRLIVQAERVEGPEPPIAQGDSS